MKKLFLAFLVQGVVIATSVTTLAYEDRRDHDWNDEYWRQHHYGYWHGQRGYWIYRDHKHEFIPAGPDLLGFRTGLGEKGITYSAQYVAEVWGNPVGGVSSGAAYTGLMTFQGNIDLQKLVGWRGASFSTRWYWLSGQDISIQDVGNIFTISNIAGSPTVRMNELWFQQNFLGDRISIRVGQMGADSEFDLSTHSVVFLNGTFGWSPDLFTNIPNGGPAYPMGTPGVRLALIPVNWLSYQGAVFQGNPFAQNVNRYGFRWDLNASNGYFSIHELNFRVNQSSRSGSLPGTFRIGGWFDTAPEPDADTAQPWNYGFYFVADQVLYRVARSDVTLVTDDTGHQIAGASPTNKGLGMFTHVGLCPHSSTFINFYVDGGLTYKGLIPARDNDVLGVAVAYGHLSSNAQDNLGRSNRDCEVVLEATYQIEVTPSLSLQPDLQYIIHPFGRNIADALVLGARTTLSF